MNRARTVIFVARLALIAVVGYLPWSYADKYETFRVDFSPPYAGEFYSALGLLLKSLSISTWAGGSIVLRYLLYRAP
jgi:hypothetical protein